MPDAESAAVVAAVERFCRQAVEPRRARPEQPLAPADLDGIESEARSMGLVPGDGDPGLGLWEEEGAEGLRRTLASLERLGRASAGAAFHLHRISLAGRLARRLGLSPPRRPALCLSGLGGFRAGLARALGAGPSAEEAALLRQALPRPGGGGPAIPVHAAPGWDELWAAGWDEGGACLLRRPRATLRVDAAGPQHGLDEIPACEVRLQGGAPAEVVAGGAEAKALLAEALGLEALGLVAAALGAARRALAIARDHAATRRQGGAAIREHGAVQQLLGEARAAVDAVSLALAGVDGPPRSPAGLLPLLGLRAAAHPLLQAAASHAMQVLGGTGYMRDAGVERILRDQNHLAILSGSPRELWLALARAEAEA